MNPVNAFLIYILFWWVTLFAVLPFGVRGQAEEDDIVPGTEPGAPIKPDIKKKVIYTTIISLILWAMFFAVVKSGLIDITKLSPFGDIE